MQHQRLEVAVQQTVDGVVQQKEVSEGVVVESGKLRKTKCILRKVVCLATKKSTCKV